MNNEMNVKETTAVESKQELNFRNLRADEIEVRVQSTTRNSTSVLLYMDVRAAMNVLDETVGPLDWGNSYSRENRNCIIAIWDEKKGQWVKKEDVGTESDYEKEKGLASDAFKRAAFRWGIGRSLYTAPDIWIDNKNLYFADGRCKTKFKVMAIDYDEYDRICYLVIGDEKTNKVLYKYGKPFKESQESQKAEEPKAEMTEEKAEEPKTQTASVTAREELIAELKERLAEEEVPESFFLNAFKVTDMHMLETKQLNASVKQFSKIKTAYSKARVLDFIRRENTTLDIVQTVAETEDWNQIAFMLDVIKETLDETDEIPYN